MLTLTEFVELFMDIAMLKAGRYWNKRGKGAAAPRAPVGAIHAPPIRTNTLSSFHMQEQVNDKADFPPVEETSDLETDRSDSVNKEKTRHKRAPRKGKRSGGPSRKKVMPSSDYGSDTSADNRSGMSGTPQGMTRTPYPDSGEVGSFSPEDYVSYSGSGAPRGQEGNQQSPPPPYSSREVTNDSLTNDEGRNTSRDIYLHLT